MTENTQGTDPQMERREPVTPPNEPETRAETTDDQIDDLLREVEELKASSPIKLPVGESNESTPDTSLPSSHLETSPESEVDQAMSPAVKAEKQKPNIPKSISQALTSSSLKVLKVRDKNVAPKFIGIKPKEDPVANKKIEALQQREYELNIKSRKLQKEIDYLRNLIETASVSSNLAELRKLKYAIERLEDFLDQKEKEKYEIGIQLTRALRKRVDSGDYGEFWSN
jgi:hypothetical protein